MHMTPAMKGQLTKARKAHVIAQNIFSAVRTVYERFGYPREQAKHATRNYLDVA